MSKPPTSDLAEAWRVNDHMNSTLLEAIPDASLGDRYSKRTRAVASQFAHLHNVRVSHLERRGQDLAVGLNSFERGAEPTRRELVAALKKSTAAIAKLLDRGAADGKIKGWSNSPATYLGYLLAHEAHHRGLAIVSLRLSGTKLSKDVTYGIWAWGKKYD